MPIACPPADLDLSVDGGATDVSLTAATVGDIAVANEDIIGFNPGGSASLQFDGSDVGLGGVRHRRLCQPE